VSCRGRAKNNGSWERQGERGRGTTFGTSAEGEEVEGRYGVVTRARRGSRQLNPASENDDPFCTHESWRNQEIRCYSRETLEWQKVKPNS